MLCAQQLNMGSSVSSNLTTYNVESRYFRTCVASWHSFAVSGTTSFIYCKHFTRYSSKDDLTSVVMSQRF